MAPVVERRWLEWDKTGDVIVVQFLTRRIQDEQTILDIFKQLNRLQEEGGVHKLVLNFGNVDYFASYAVGKLISLHKKLRAAKGQLALCCLTPVVAEIIDIMNLRRVFSIFGSEQDALQSF